MLSNKSNKLESLRNRVHCESKEKASVDTIIFHLAKELSCLGDIIGKKYDGHIQFWRFKIHFNFIQRPMKMHRFMALLRELQKYAKKQKKNMPKIKKPGRGRR